MSLAVRSTVVLERMLWRSPSTLHVLCEHLDRVRHVRKTIVEFIVDKHPALQDQAGRWDVLVEERWKRKEEEDMRQWMQDWM